MILSKKMLLLGSLVATLNATSLKEVINMTLENNDNLKSIQTINLSKKKAYDGVDNIYNPTVNIGANILRVDGDKRAVQIGTTSTGFVKFGLELYNGGKSSAIKKQKEYEYKSAQLSSVVTKKETILQTVNLFFQIQTTKDNIKVLEEKGSTLKAQYERVKTKYDIKMTTKDEVLKLQSEYESNQYSIEELKYQKEMLLQNLSLLAGKEIISLDKSSVPDILNFDFQKSENIKAVEYSIKAQEENTKIIESVNYPQIKIEDSYNFYDYNDKILSDLPDQQNQFMATISYNLFDTGSKSKIEAAKLAKLASTQKLNYLTRQEKMIFDLAKKQLATMQLKIKSQKSAAKMGNSVYEIVKVKYQNGIVDNITYLDALSKKIYNQALYQKALNDYEVAKANYYFSSGVDYKNILDKI